MTEMNKPMPIVFIPHGGGPLPLMNEPNHLELIRFLRRLGPELGKPKAILMISAHWEESVATVSSSPAPGMVYDYYGFPRESYELQYPAAGEPQLAQEVISLLREQGIEAAADPQRGFDHGTFVPLSLLYPEADVPVVQLSLVNSLDPKEHLAIGAVIARLAEQGVLVVGSGQSFHNLQVLMRKEPEIAEKALRFDQWLNRAVLGNDLSDVERREQLLQWESAPDARFAHPREEHLLPLFVCLGAAEAAQYTATNIFDQYLLGVKNSGFMWQAQ